MKSRLFNQFISSSRPMPYRLLCIHHVSGANCLLYQPRVCDFHVHLDAIPPCKFALTDPPPLLFLIGWNHPASITPLWHNLCDCERTSALDVDVTCFRHELPHNPTTSTVIKSIDFLFLYRSTAHYYILSTFRQSAACISVLRCIGMWIGLMREWRQIWQAAGGY